MYGDSLIAGQPSTTAQGWDNLYLGLLRTWSLTAMRGFTADIVRDSQYYTPTPDHNGAVSWATAHTVKKPNNDNDWTTSSTADTGVFGMLNGVEVAGVAQGLTTHIEVDFLGATLAAMAGYPQLTVLQGTELRVSAIQHHHTDGALGQIQLVLTGGTNQAATINTAQGSGITKTSTPVSDASSATAVEVNYRQVNGNGDQTGNYFRLGQILFENTAVTGVTFTGCGIGGADILDITNELGDTPAGLCDDSALSAYRTVTGATTAFICVGRNNNGDSYASLKSDYDALLARYAAAGYTHILGIGNPRCTTISDENASTLNRAFYAATVDHGTAEAGFVTTYNAARLADTHPTQAEADAIANVIQINMLATGTHTITSGVLDGEIGKPLRGKM